MTNLHKRSLRIPLNQSVTVSVFLHWFEFIVSCTFLFDVSKMALLIRHNSLFAGIMIRLDYCQKKYMIFQSYKTCSRHFFPFGLATLYFLRFACHQYWSAFLCSFWFSYILRLWRCLSCDCIPLLLISKGFQFHQRKGRSNLAI